MGPKLNRDWVGLRVRLTRSAKNGFIKVPSGTEGTVTSYSTGIWFEGDPCKCCGVSVRISGMDRRDFTIITPIEEWPDTRGQGRKRN